MRIAYLCEMDAGNVDVMSGYPYAFLTQFERLGHEVIRVFPLSRGKARQYLPLQAAYRALGQTYRPDREIGYLRSLAAQAQERLRGIDYDVAFAPGSHLVAEINLDRPIVFCADASFASVLNQYWDFTNCARRFVRLGHRQEQRAHDRCAAVLYPSEVFAREAQQTYGVSSDKLHVVPWGAIFEVLPAQDIVPRIQTRAGHPLRILFMGKDWKRKGADIALAACQILMDRGVDLVLDLVGIAEPPVDLPPFVRYHGLINKREPDGYRKMVDLFSQSDLFFVPSRAENYGLVFCEALAFGVPVVTTAVGGITTIVRNGQNGFALPLAAGPRDYADVIESELLDRDRRHQLSRAAVSDYHERLTWDEFGRQCTAILSQVAGLADRNGPAPGR
jgi:glycosyltransferase involved in cell wall biosynthesis